MAFYKGYVPNMLGIIPYAGIDLAVYEVGGYTMPDHNYALGPFYYFSFQSKQSFFLNILH